MMKLRRGKAGLCSVLIDLIRGSLSLCYPFDQAHCVRSFAGTTRKRYSFSADRGDNAKYSHAAVVGPIEPENMKGIVMRKPQIVFIYASALLMAFSLAILGQTRRRAQQQRTTAPTRPAPQPSPSPQPTP